MGEFLNRHTRIRRALALLLLFLIPGAADAAEAARTVEIRNLSEPVLCAEKDNVAIAFSGAGITRFRVEASHPAYIGMIQRDNADPNWNDCDMSGDASFAPPAPPRQVTLYDGAGLRIVGFTFSSFWRPASTSVRVGQRVERGLHLIQLWVPGPHGWEEVLVLYPPDGYWRARPLTPDGLAGTAYGSSFLVGPIEQQGRPLVRIDEVAIDVEARAVRLNFVQGGSATVTIADVNRLRNAIDIAFDPPMPAGSFAMLRSMYVTETNNDVAHVALREPGGAGWREEGIMRFDKALATEFWAGREIPSRHNTSAPDMVFRAFMGSLPPQ